MEGGHGTVGGMSDQDYHTGETLDGADAGCAPLRGAGKGKKKKMKVAKGKRRHRSETVQTPAGQKHRPQRKGKKGKKQKAQETSAMELDPTTAMSGDSNVSEEEENSVLAPVQKKRRMRPCPLEDDVQSIDSLPETHAAGPDNPDGHQTEPTLRQTTIPEWLARVKESFPEASPNSTPEHDVAAGRDDAVATAASAPNAEMPQAVGDSVHLSEEDMDLDGAEGADSTAE